MARPSGTAGQVAPRSSRPEGERTWYVVRVRPGGLNRALTNLERQGVITYVPERARTTRRNGRLVTSLRPLFPGYLFVAVGSDDVPWRSINATFGVANVVCLVPGRPAPVPAELIATLRAYCDCEEGMDGTSRYHPGDRVRIVLGPFADMTARIEAVSEKERIHVLLDMMGRSVRTRVHATDLEPIS